MSGMKRVYEELAEMHGLDPCEESTVDYVSRLWESMDDSTRSDLVDRVFPKHHNVFVYGTLKRGGKFNPLLGESAEYVDDGSCHGIRLESLGNCPAAIPDDNASTLGEIYRIDSEALYRLDRLESHPIMYRRTIAPIYTSSDSAIDCFVYVWVCDSYRTTRISPIVDNVYSWRI